MRMSAWIEDFHESDLQMDRWKNTFIKENAVIKKSALNFLSVMLGFPLEVVKGRIGNLQIRFSWTKLWSEPIIVHI